MAFPIRKPDNPGGLLPANHTLYEILCRRGHIRGPMPYRDHVHLPDSNIRELRNLHSIPLHVLSLDPFPTVLFCHHLAL